MACIDSPVISGVLTHTTSLRHSFLACSLRVVTTAIPQHCYSLVSVARRDGKKLRSLRRERVCGVNPEPQVVRMLI